jgi:nucleotide-binding universal stress UspA family protein
MKKIIVPVDFSSQASNALDLALQLAERRNSKVHMLHMIDVPLVGNPVGMSISPTYELGFLEKLKLDGKSQMEDFLIDFKNTENVETEIKIGNVYSGIIDKLDEDDIDLIVMGTKGTSGVKEFLIGSNTEKIVRSANCPVIAIRDMVKLDKLKNIVFATTGHEISEDLMAHLKQLQEMLDAKLHIVRINTPNNFERDIHSNKLLKEIANRFMLKNYTINIYNDVSEDIGIMDFANHMDADIIAIGTHGRKGLDHFVSGSIAEDIVNHSKIISWTYRIKKDN